MDQVIDRIIGVSVGSILVATFGMEAVKLLVNATGLTSGTIQHTMVTIVLSIMVIVAFLLVIIKAATGKK